MKFRDHHASCHGFNPVRPSGGEWTHAMMLHDGSTVYADTAAEIVEEMMPGLDSLDEPARSQARIRHAARTAADVQQMVIDRARYEGTFDPDDAEVAPLVQILVTDKSLSLSLELPQHPGEPADWLPVVPLVLLATSYAPTTEYPRIGGNVIWIDPATDESYLASLNATGLFSYWAAETAGTLSNS